VAGCKETYRKRRTEHKTNISHELLGSQEKSEGEIFPFWEKVPRAEATVIFAANAAFHSGKVILRPEFVVARSFLSFLLHNIFVVGCRKAHRKRRPNHKEMN